MTERHMLNDAGYDRLRPPPAALEPWPKPTTTNGLAVASFILGLLSLFVCSVFSGLPAVVLGTLGLRAVRRRQGTEQGGRLAITGIVTGCLSFLLAPLVLYLTWPAPAWIWESPSRIRSAKNMKQISAGMHAHLAATGAFPPAAICDTAGRPLLSWRMAILPFVGCGSLYTRFNLNEPWDGPNNSKLLSQMPDIYALPGDTTAPPGYTFYRVFVSKPGTAGAHAAFDWREGAYIPRDFPDGQSNTILVAEAATAVPWTKPDELVYDDNDPLPPLGGHYACGFHVVIVEGSIRFLPSDIDSKTLRSAITRNGGEGTGSSDW